MGTVDLADNLYKLIIAREAKENEESNSQPVVAIPPQNKPVNKELFGALEMVWAYLDQLVNDGYKLPNIDIVQGSNTAALNYAKEVMENE